MSWHRRIDSVLAHSATKREAAEALGVHGSTLGSYVIERRSDLHARWRSLPSDGAFAMAGNRKPPKATSTPANAEMAALVGAAAEVAPPDPDFPTSANCLRLMLAMFRLSGTLNWPRGYVRGIMLALEDAGCATTTQRVVRWYRSKLSTDPEVRLGRKSYLDGFEREIELLCERAYR